MLLNSSRQRRPWQRGPMRMQLSKHRRSKHVAVERSLKMQTPQLRRTLWSQRRRRLSQRRQRWSRRLKRGTVHEVTADRTWSTRSRGAPDWRNLLTKLISDRDFVNRIVKRGAVPWQAQWHVICQSHEVWGEVAEVCGWARWERARGGSIHSVWECIVAPFSSRELTRMCKEVSSAVHAKTDTAMREGQSDADRHRTDVTVWAEHGAITWHVVKETVLNGLIVLEGWCWEVKHAPSWYKAVEHFHGGVDDVVFGEKRCCRTMFVRWTAWTWNPATAVGPRSVTPTKIHDTAAAHTQISQTKRSELDPRWSTCSSTSRNRVTHLFATWTRRRKAQCHSMKSRVKSCPCKYMTSNAQLSSESMQSSRCSPSHAAEGVRWKGSDATGAARSEQLGSKRPFSRPRGGYKREQRPDAALDVLAAGTAQAREEHKTPTVYRLHQTCRLVNQFEHVCVEECPLTTRHTAKRSGDSCGESHRASAGVHPGGRSGESQTTATNHDRPTRRRSERAHSCRVATWESWAERIGLSDGWPPSTWRSVRKRTRGSARERASSSSRQCKPLTNQGTTLRRRCEYGARGARLTHSQAAGSEYSSRRQASTKDWKERTHSG